jgi:hypothetical protein
MECFGGIIAAILFTVFIYRYIECKRYGIPLKDFFKRKSEKAAWKKK